MKRCASFFLFFIFCPRNTKTHVNGNGELFFPYLLSAVFLSSYKYGNLCLHAVRTKTFFFLSLFFRIVSVVLKIPNPSKLKRCVSFLSFIYFWRFCYFRNCRPTITVISGTYADKDRSSGGCGFSWLTWGGGGQGFGGCGNPETGAIDLPFGGSTSHRKGIKVNSLCL